MNVQWRGVFSNMVLVEAGGHGDCLFYCLAKALKTTMQNMRNLLGDSITSENMSEFLESARTREMKNTWVGNESLAVVKKYVSVPHKYLGTDWTLEWLAKYYPALGYAVLSSYGPAFTTFIPGKEILILFNWADSCHWQLVYIDKKCIVSIEDWQKNIYPKLKT